MNAAPTELFSLVKIPSEKKRIFKELIQNKSEIIIKGEKDNLHLHFIRAQKMTENRWIVCEPAAGSDIKDEANCIANFALGSERYFFQTPVQVSKLSVMLEADVELYHLQRRKSIRVALPEILGASCTIINHNHFSVLHDCNIIDFSKGGVKLFYPHPFPDFKIGDFVSISIKLGENKRSFVTEGTIRHTSEMTLNSQTFGIQFVNMNRTLEQKILTLQMDLQSEIFRKWRSNK